MMGAYLGVIIVGIPFIFVLMILWIRSRETTQRNKLRAEVYARALERGEKLPDDLFEDSHKKKNASLRTGIILVFTGIGISLFMWLVGAMDDVLKSLAIGLIPLFLGIGFLVVHFVYKKMGLPDEE